MSLSCGFSPVVGENTKLVILGSMPGVASIEQQQYYAHPRNSFWRLMAEIYGFTPDASYDSRCEILRDNGVLLWDVLASAYRKGSLDSAIVSNTMVVNDFSFLLNKPSLPVFCNGSKAFHLFNTKVVKPLSLTNSIYSMPSTSPAYAAMPYIEKLRIWSNALTTMV